jgi:hypothetical protein
MNVVLMVAVDVVGIAVLALGLFFRRHRRRDLVVAFLAVNLGVLAVTIALTNGAVGVGLGLGLFGVLSIIRLRSDEIDQHAIAYYFVALAMGLVSGVVLTPTWLAPALIAVMLGALYVGDHPRVLGRYRVAVLTLERAYPDEAELVRHLADTLGAAVHQVRVRRINLVDDTTLVEVRYELPAPGAAPAPAPGAAPLAAASRPVRERPAPAPAATADDLAFELDGRPQ